MERDRPQPRSESQGRLFRARLDELQPSQLYICEEKLASVLASVQAGGRSLEPLPLFRFRDRLVLSDGHTRGVAAHLLGIAEVPAFWEEEELDWEAYAICVDWCLGEGVRSIGDLAGRIVPGRDYGRLWIERCAAMHRDLASKRLRQEKGGEEVV